jgi:hypothetical protein
VIARTASVVVALLAVLWPADAGLAAARDTTPPSAPRKVTATATSASTVVVRWRAARDNVRVSRYLVFRNGKRRATLGAKARKFTDRRVAAATRYVYVIRARDRAGNLSPKRRCASKRRPRCKRPLARAVVKTPAAPLTPSLTPLESVLPPLPGADPVPVLPPASTPAPTPTPATDGILVNLPVSPSAETIRTQLSTQDVWNGTFANLPGADGVSPQARLNALAPPNMRFHAGSDGGWADSNEPVVLPFPPPPLGSALPYHDTGSGMTISTPWDFDNLNDLMSEATAFGGPSGSPVVLNLRYMPDNMYTGTHRFGAEGTFSDRSYDASAEYYAAVLKYYNTNGASPPVAGMTPWPKPAGPWPIKYVEIYNEPDYSSENPRIPPTLTGPALSLQAVSGGSLDAGTYSYRASGLNSTGSPGNGESAAGAVASITLDAADITAGRRSVRLTWSAPDAEGLSPSAYVIYGRTSSRRIMSVVGSEAPGGRTFTDTGAIAPGGPSAPNGDRGTGGGGPVFSPLEYRAFWDKVAAALKAVDPSVKLVGPATTNPVAINAPSVITTAGPTNGPNDDSYIDYRNYYEVLMDASEPNKPDVISYHGYGGWEGTESNAQLLQRIDDMATDVKTEVLPHTGDRPLWQTEDNVNAAGLVSGDGRATNQFAAAWWGKLFGVMANTSPHIERLYQYTITESPTFDLLWDSTYSGLAGSRAGRPTLPYWAIKQLNQAFPPGSKLLGVSGAPAGTTVLAAVTAPSYDHVSVLVVNAPDSAQPVSGTVTINGATVTSATRHTIDEHTSMATGPAQVDAGATNRQPLALDGYGLTIYGFDL